jgi:hypothetical protein
MVYLTTTTKTDELAFNQYMNATYYSLTHSHILGAACRRARPLLVTILNLNSFDFSQIFEICFELTSF